MWAAVAWGDLGIGAAIGVVVSAVFGYLFYWLAFRRSMRRLVFRSFSWPLVERGDAHKPEPTIEVRYRGTEIPRLTRTRIALWNAGWRSIDAGDISDVDPPVISFRDGEVLAVENVSMTRTAVAFHAFVDNARCFFTFELLDRHDGAVLDVLHTGPLTVPIFRGAIKGLHEGVENFGRLVPTETRSSRRPRDRRTTLRTVLTHVLLWGGVAAYTVGATVGGAYIGKTLGDDEGPLPVVFIIVFLFGPLVAILVGGVWRDRLRNAPEGLRGVDEDR